MAKILGLIKQLLCNHNEWKYVKRDKDRPMSPRPQYILCLKCGKMTRMKGPIDYGPQLDDPNSYAFGPEDEE